MRDWRILEQVKDAETPEEMRAELFRLRFHDRLVKAVWDLADYNGMSAEDRYTILSYNAVRDKIKAQQSVLEFSSFLVRPKIEE